MKPAVNLIGLSNLSAYRPLTSSILDLQVKQENAAHLAAEVWEVGVDGVHKAFWLKAESLVASVISFKVSDAVPLLIYGFLVLTRDETVGIFNPFC